MATINIQEEAVIMAAQKGMDAFINVFCDAYLKEIGGELNADTMQQLSGEQLVLLAYQMFRDEVMDGGFVQLIHNGLGGFIFLNPVARVMREWGAPELTKLLYKGRQLFEQYGEELMKDCNDEEFMALFEQYPQFDDLDDAFIEMEEQVTSIVAHYVDEHLELFADIVKE